MGPMGPMDMGGMEAFILGAMESMDPGLGAPKVGDTGDFLWFFTGKPGVFLGSYGFFEVLGSWDIGKLKSKKMGVFSLKPA